MLGRGADGGNDCEWRWWLEKIVLLFVFLFYVIIIFTNITIIIIIIFTSVPLVIPYAIFFCLAQRVADG